MFAYPGFDPMKSTSQVTEQPGMASWGAPQGFSGIGQGFWGANLPQGSQGGGMQGRPIMGPGGGGNPGLPGGGQLGYGGGMSNPGWGGQQMHPGMQQGMVGGQGGQQQGMPQQPGMNQQSPYFGGGGMQPLLYSLFQQLFSGNPSMMYSPVNMSGAGSNGYPFSNIGSLY